MYSLKLEKICGQGSLEYFTIFAAVLVIIASLTVSRMIDPCSEAARTGQHLSRARSAADIIAGAINTIYANSQGAVITESISLNTRWMLEIENCPPTLIVRVSTPDGWKKVDESLKYNFPNLGLGGLDNSLPLSPKNYDIIVEWTSNSKEGIDNSAIQDEKIFIYINPRC